MKARDRFVAHQSMLNVWLADRGASMVEYALLVILIAIVALVAVTVAGTELSETYSEIASGLTEAGP